MTTQNGKHAYLAHPQDNVATVMERVLPGDAVTITGAKHHHLLMIKSADVIEPFHKVCIRMIPKGDVVLKFGEAIGLSSESIPQGAHVHIQNVTSKRL